MTDFLWFLIVAAILTGPGCKVATASVVILGRSENEPSLISGGADRAWGVEDQSLIFRAGSLSFLYDTYPGCREMSDEIGGACYTETPLQAATLHARPELHWAPVDRIGPGRASTVEVRMLNRLFYQGARRTARVTATVGSDQLLLDLDRARIAIDVEPPEEKVQQWVTLTFAVAAGSLVFSGRRQDRTLVASTGHQWSRPPPVCCWGDTVRAAQPGMQLCGDFGSGHLWPGHWRCGGSCPPPPDA